MPTRFPDGLSFVRPNLVGANTSQYTFKAGDQTPDVSKGVYFFASESAATITNFDGGELGQVIYVRGADVGTVIQHSAGGIFFASTAGNVTLGSGQTVGFIRDDAQWNELSPGV